VKPSAVYLFHLILLLLLTGYSDARAEKLEMEKADNCFSEINLTIVHNYIKHKISIGNTPYYKYEEYELYAGEQLTIYLKDKGYTLAIINKENGIVSLAIMQKNNERIVKLTAGIFCKILSMAKDQ